jgi:hypothetical protein
MGGERRIKMPNFKAMKAVYCYFLPEVRPLLHEVEAALPDDMWFVTTPAAEVRKNLETLFNPPLELPETKDGNIDLDEIHVPVIERILAAYSDTIANLDDFDFRYPTSGSSEGLFHLLAKYSARGVKSINLLQGEYEGYAAYAEHLGMNVNWINPDKTDIKKLHPGLWFISNPSARDGNIIPNEVIMELCDLDHKVVLDFAYVGATADYNFEINHSNIDAVVMSFSKPYGVFRFRIGGFAFTRDETPSLYGNKWFKDTLRLMQALKLAEAIGPSAIYERYLPLQTEIVGELNEVFGLGLRVSDSFLLAHLKTEDIARLDGQQLDMIAPYQRGTMYRFCLTPYFEIKEKMRR